MRVERRGQVLVTVGRTVRGVGAEVRERRLRMTPGCQLASLTVDGGMISVVGNTGAGIAAAQPRLPQELP